MLLAPITTRRNGERKARIHWSIATWVDSAIVSTPATETRVTVGTPTEPKAVGVEFTTRQPTTAPIGSTPIPASMEAGIATAVPNPAIPSIKFPNPQPIRRSNTRLSLETLANIFLISSIAPVFKIRL